jgi:hypothetical protein
MARGSVAGCLHAALATRKLDNHRSIDVSHPVLLPTTSSAFVRRTLYCAQPVNQNRRMPLSSFRERSSLHFDIDVSQRAIANFITAIGQPNRVVGEGLSAFSQSLPRHSREPFEAEVLLQAMAYFFHRAGDNVDHALLICGRRQLRERP